MPAGNQPTENTVNNQLTSLSVQLRQIMDQIRVQLTPVQNMGVSGLEALGFGSAANPANPGSESDAQYVLTLFGYLGSLSQIYYGLLQQGGTGGTGATEFDFDSALSAAWGGQ